jgi:tetratricopeptide (TPR) repeat protein
VFLALILTLVMAQGQSALDLLVGQARQDLEAQRYEEARQALEKAVKLRPRDPVLWSYLGLAESRLNDVEGAINAFEKARAMLPADAQTCFNLGLLYWKKGDVDKALAAYQKGLQLDHSDLAANQNYALLLMAIGKYHEAVVPLQRVRQANPSQLSVRVALIEAYFKGGAKTEGERETQEALYSGILSPADQVKLAAALREDGQPEEAEKLLRHAMASGANSAEAHGALALLLLEKNQYEGAAEEFGRAAHLDPASSEYAMGLAEVLLRWKHYSTLLAFLNAVQDRFSNLPEYQYKLALAYYGLRQYPRAIEQLERVIALRPPRMDVAEYVLGNSYLAIGNFERAEDYYRKAITFNPKDPSYYEALATLLRKKRAADVDEAIALLDKALRLDPADPRVKLELALCLESKRDLAKAQGLLEEAVRKQPDLLPAHVALARVYSHEGKKLEADQEKSVVARLEAEEQKKQSQLGINPPDDLQ